jgi:predicted metalloprotease
MRWKDQRRSENVEDKRGVPPATVAVGGGIGTLVIVLIAILFGADPQKLLNQLPNNPPAAQQAPAVPNPAEEERKEFVSVVLADTEDVWQELFKKMGRTYEDPKLVLFSGQVNSACGFTSSAVGPFYCPGDKKVYIDLQFYDELKRRFKAPGEFAQAYVVAHEVGHHVQNLLGISRKVDAMRRGVSEEEANQLSVRLELQADYFAGVWANRAHKMRNILEAGDIESGLRAASAIGDDRIQMQTRGYVVPDAFTHGTSAQRVRWFKKGLEAGDISHGDTFSADEL